MGARDLNWRRTPLGKVCKIVGGSTPNSGVERYWGGEIIWVTPTDLGRNEGIYVSSSERRITQEGYESCGSELVPAGSVVMSSRAPIGHVAIARVELCTNQGCKTFVPSDKVDSLFVYFALRHAMRGIRELGSGATFSEVSKSQLEAFEISLPDVTEQKRIAAILNEQMAAVEKACAAAEAQHKCAQELTASILRSVFDSADAQGWPRKSIGEFAETTSGATPSRGNAAYFGGAVPWIKTGELRDNLIESAQERVTELALAECSLPLLPEGTLLIAMYGQGQTRGRTGLLSIPATTNQACFAILPAPSSFEPRFLQYWFRHSYQRLRRETEGRGGNQPNLNGILLRNLQAPLPPVSEQRQIADALDRELLAAEKISEAVEQNVSTVDALPAVLLRRAFSGEL